MALTAFDYQNAFPLQGPLIAGLTDREFAAFCHDNQPMRMERTADREIIFMPPAFSETSRLNFILNLLLGQWWLQNQQLGITFESSGGFRLPDTSMRSPDAAWVSMAKWQALTTHQRKREFAPVCPEFVVELRSDSDTLASLKKKMTNTWLANGTQLAFLLDVEAETAYVYRAGQPEPEVLVGFDRELSGEPVLPGFRLDLRLLR